MTTATHQLDLISESELARYAKLIYGKTGITISPQKRMLLSNRLRRRLKATGIKTFEVYFNRLQSLPMNDAEWDAFLQEVTTHETYLFRDKSNWDWLRKEYLAEITRQARQGERPKRLKVWSAACSTGDEAHTIAACVHDGIVNVREWKIEILGTDIGIEAVNSARQSKFSEKAMRLVPDTYRTRFFVKDKNEKATWSARPVLTSCLEFRQHNLMDPMTEPEFDLIFLKNVLIYFDSESKAKVLKHVCDVLKPGGYLVTGAAEGVADHLRDLERKCAWLHRKPSA